jgi:enoyl-CoA hydratase
MAQFVNVEERGEVAVVRVDRPPANALDPDLLQQGQAVAEELRGAEPAAVVIVGRERFFSAGVDLKLVPQLDADGHRAMVEGINHLFLAWYSFPRPVVCAVNGHAIAGGLILALCGDYRVCARGDAKLGLTELRAGIPYPSAAMAIVKAELEPSAVRVLALGAELVGPDAALQLGMVDELADPDDVLPRAVEVAEGYAALPRGAYARVKDQVRGAAVSALREVVESGGDPMLAGWVGDETAEASAAILDAPRS